MYTFHAGYQKTLGIDVTGVPSMTKGANNMIPMTQIMSLEGKVAIVSGGAMGMGFCIVHRLCEAGAKVVIADVADEYAQKALEYFGTQGYQVKYCKTDVRDVAQIRACVEFTKQNFGGIDILVNDAAVWKHCLLSEITEESWNEAVDVNLKGTLFFVQAVAKVMEEQGRGGKIVNIASIAGLSNDPAPLMYEYVASKSGVVGLSKSLVRALKPIGVNINCVVPGGMVTPGAINTVRSDAAKGLNVSKCPVADPDEVARVVYALTTELASFMHGAVVAVDGGDLMHVL